eukprot:TRINITY_DN3364_c1_g1_i1.p1 TRINITY_DN3364_c1_g1~~TRINITY_DN3364_c1_g1_i1.p1  ORF type:complete len:305 (+),score=46.88 TRINITY_DN3364_c1_g1_i1:177-1091(+)
MASAGVRRTVGRTVIVGDVHGCAEDLKALLTKIKFRGDVDVNCLTEDLDRNVGERCDDGRLRGGSVDRLFFVGDLVNKGPSSHEVVSIARMYKATCVRGNHEERWLTLKNENFNGDYSRQKPPSEAEMREMNKFTAQDWAYVSSWPLYSRHEMPEGENKLKDGSSHFVMVHAGFVPGVDYENQEPINMMKMRNLVPVIEDGALEGPPRYSATENIKIGEKWAQFWDGDDLVVFGHDALRRLQVYPKAVGLDTGCLYGGKLSALILPGREVVHVDAKEVYCVPTGTVVPDPVQGGQERGASSSIS